MKLSRTVFLILLLTMLFACSKKEEPVSSKPVAEVETAEPEIIPAPAPEAVEEVKAEPPPEVVEKPVIAESVELVAQPPMSVDVDDDEVIEIVEVVPGLEMKVLRTGDGSAAVPGDRVEVHYTGWVFDVANENGRGSKFDSSVDRGERYRFPLGEGRVIDGWDLGIEGMLVGEIRELKVAPELAYGDEGAGAVIPPGATLIFEIELFEISAADIN